MGIFYEIFEYDSEVKKGLWKPELQIHPKIAATSYFSVVSTKPLNLVVGH